MDNSSDTSKNNIGSRDGREREREKEKEKDKYATISFRVSASYKPVLGEMAEFFYKKGLIDRNSIHDAARIALYTIANQFLEQKRIIAEKEEIRKQMAEKQRSPVKVVEDL